MAEVAKTHLGAQKHMPPTVLEEPTGWGSPEDWRQYESFWFMLSLWGAGEPGSLFCSHSPDDRGSLTVWPGLQGLCKHLGIVAGTRQKCSYHE